MDLDARLRDATMSATEAARVLDVDPATIRRWIACGYLEGRTDGGATRPTIGSVERRLPILHVLHAV